jgi:hypothetical protein
MRVLAVVLACTALPVPGLAQARLTIDASVGAGGDAGRAAVSVWRTVLRGPLRARASLGLRASGYVAMASPYQNRGTSQAGLAPTLAIDPGVIGVAAAIAGDIPVGPLSLGANLDLVGLSAGSRWTQGSLEGEPQRISLFQNGPADRGALNSEFYVAFRVGARLVIRAGASHYVTNYEVTDTGAPGRPSARYQRFETVPFAALRIGM